MTKIFDSRETQILKEAFKQYDDIVCDSDVVINNVKK